jgi:hypothetical protein
MDSFEEVLEDLGGEVKILSNAPVFNGTYSRVYRGQIRRNGELVCLFEVLLTTHRLKILSGRNQGSQRSRRYCSPYDAKSKPPYISNLLPC